jgi:glycosyltransferase involved in cell wall biosynthesis
VVIPAYDAERFIVDSLESVRRQTLRDCEIVVIDDGSRDATRTRVEEWSRLHPDMPLRLISQANRGIGGARNAGVFAAHGDFLAFLDADDAWLDRKLDAVAEHLSAHPDVDLVCHDERLDDGSGRRRVLRHGPYSMYEDLLLGGNALSTSATVVRRDHVLALNGFSEDLRFNGAEDYDLWLRLAQAGCRFAYLREILGLYRVHDGGITAKAEYHCQNTLNVLHTHFSALPSPTLAQRYAYRRHRAATIRGAIRTLMRQRNHRSAARLLMSAAREDPLSPKTWVLSVLNAAHVSP